MSATSPLISVIIPAYNQAAYISEAIQSVLAQTFPHFELIVVDDGSTDETPEILAELRDPRIRVIRQPNAGLSAARNTGLRASSAPLVTFLDADDYFLPTKLEVLSAYLDQHPEVGMVAGRVRYIDQRGQLILEPAPPSIPLSLPHLLFANPVCVSAVLLRRNWLDRVGVFDESLRACEDWDLWLRLLAADCPMSWVPDLVVAYRVHPGQMTRQADRMRIAAFATLDKFYRRPDLSPDLLALRNKVYATGWVHSAAYAYLADEPDKGAAYLDEALRLDPSLGAPRSEQLADLLVSWAHDPRSSGPSAFLQRVIAHPPGRLPALRRQLRRALADALLAPLFGSPKEIWRVCRQDFLQAIRYKPTWLFNRGVIRMLIYAWFRL